MKSVAIAALTCMTSPAFAATCHVDPFNFIFGSDTSTHMSVGGGGPCRIGVRAGLVESRVESPPANGSLSTVDKAHWLDKPQPGYTGKDAFVLFLSGSGHRRQVVISGDTHLSVGIDVGP